MGTSWAFANAARRVIYIRVLNSVVKYIIPHGTIARKERKNMKMRSDSAFAKLTEDQCDMLVALSQEMTLDQVLEVLKKAPEPIVCTLGALSRF
jgi:hypothetical protein